MIDSLCVLSLNSQSPTSPSTSGDEYCIVALLEQPYRIFDRTARLYFNTEAFNEANFIVDDVTRQPILRDAISEKSTCFLTSLKHCDWVTHLDEVIGASNSCGTCSYNGHSLVLVYLRFRVFVGTLRHLVVGEKPV